MGFAERNHLWGLLPCQGGEDVLSLGAPPPSREHVLIPITLMVLSVSEGPNHATGFCSWLPWPA